MKALLRRLIELEKHAPDTEGTLTPLPPPGASEEEVRRAGIEALQQFYAHPHQSGLYLRVIQIAQRRGITSTHGAEKFNEDSEEHHGHVDPMRTRESACERKEGLV